MDDKEDYARLKQSVLEAISQLQQEMKGQKTIINKRSEVVKILPSATVNTAAPSNTMEILSSKLLALAEQTGVTASDQMLLKSLWFDSIHQRQENIAISHEKTFQWALDPSSPTQLQHWLRNQNGLYWITGKAGSGKSTLMKFLLNNAVEYVEEWAGTTKLVTASFFFWNASRDALQKSQIGLFRSLLYKILSQCPEMIRSVCAFKAQSFHPFAKESEPWTQRELWLAIEQLKQYDGAQARFCFFIDGLDEYEGDPDQLIRVLESLRGWQNIKLCVSSRPWNEFIDAFGRPADPQLAVEDLTREDIRTYIRGTLENSFHFRQLKERDSRSQNIVDEIVEKARGVFLWVVLVVKSLINGLRNRDRIFDLQMRLRDFPDSLEQYFSHMLDSIEAVYRKQTAEAFTFALEAITPLSLLTYSFLDEEDLDAFLTNTNTALMPSEISKRLDDMRKRLNGRCKGLLEVNDDNPMGLTVDFFHRTVYDFLNTKNMQTMLTENLSPGFEPKMLLCKALFAQMTLTNIKRHSIQDILDDILFYCAELEKKLNVAHFTLIDQVAQWVSEKRGGHLDFLIILVHRRLHLYMRDTLARKPLRSDQKTALLAYALEPQMTKYYNPRHDPSVIQVLLDSGAAPNSKHQKSTVWGSFLLSLHEHVSLAVGVDELKKVIELLLDFGANPQLRIVTGQRTRASAPETGRASDLHRTRKTILDEYMSAQEILTQRLGGQEASRLLQKAQRPHQPGLKSLIASFKGLRFGSR